MHAWAPSHHSYFSSTDTSSVCWKAARKSRSTVNRLSIYASRAPLFHSLDPSLSIASSDGVRLTASRSSWYQVSANCVSVTTQRLMPGHVDNADVTTQAHCCHKHTGCPKSLFTPLTYDLQHFPERYSPKIWYCYGPNELRNTLHNGKLFYGTMYLSWIEEFTKDVSESAVST